MWKDFFSLIQTIITIGKEQERMRKDIERVERTQLEHSLLLQRLSDLMEMNRQREQDAQEKLALQLQVELLKFEKRLLPAPPEKKNKK
jgi:hypothetical protein